MTEKRFIVYNDDDADIWEDNHFLAVAYDHYNALKFAKRLNELYKKKEELESKIKSIQSILMKDIGYVESFKKIEEVLKDD